MRSDVQTHATGESRRNTGGSNRTAAAAPAREDETPLGLILIVILGLLGSVLAILFSLSLFVHGVPGLLLGSFLILVALFQIWVLIELLARKEWALYAALFLYGTALLLHYVSGNLLGLGFDILVIGYLMAKSHLFYD